MPMPMPILHPAPVLLLLPRFFLCLWPLWPWVWGSMCMATGDLPTCMAAGLSCTLRAQASFVNVRPPPPPPRPRDETETGVFDADAERDAAISFAPLGEDPKDD